MSLTLFNTLAKKYDEWFDRNTEVYLSELEALKEVVPKTGEGLEIGVGTGRFALPLNVFVGIDPSMGMVEIARSRAIRVVVGYGEDLPFGDGEFDWVLINTTLCFVRNPGKVLKGAERVMKRGGKIVIGIINRESSLGRYYQSRRNSFYKKVNFYSAEEVIELLHTCGFEDFLVHQTIFRPPGQIKEMNEVKEGHEEGGFVVMSGEKRW